MIELAVFVLAYFKDEGVEPLINPTDGSMLFGHVGTVVLVVGAGEELLCFFESDPALQVPRNRSLLRRSKWNRTHKV